VARGGNVHGPAVAADVERRTVHQRAQLGKREVALQRQDAPALGYLVIAPKGLPPAVSARLGEAVRKVVEGAEFRKTLANLEIPYDYKDRQQLDKEIAEHSLFYKGLLENLGVKPE
jgi:hypothetical protein